MNKIFAWIAVMFALSAVTVYGETYIPTVQVPRLGILDPMETSQFLSSFQNATFTGSCFGKAADFEILMPVRYNISMTLYDPDGFTYRHRKGNTFLEGRQMGTSPTPGITRPDNDMRVYALHDPIPGFRIVNPIFGDEPWGIRTTSHYPTQRMSFQSFVLMPAFIIDGDSFYGRGWSFNGESGTLTVINIPSLAPWRRQRGESFQDEDIRHLVIGPNIGNFNSELQSITNLASITFKGETPPMLFTASHFLYNRTPALTGIFVPHGAEAAYLATSWYQAIAQGRDLPIIGVCVDCGEPDCVCFGEVPPTGIADISALMYIMFAFTVLSAGLWKVALRKKTGEM